MAVQQLPPGIDKRRIRSGLRKAHAQYEALEEAWESLLAEHEGEWVAGYNGQFIFGRELEGVLKKAARRRWPLSIIAIDYLTRERPAILL